MSGHGSPKFPKQDFPRQGHSPIKVTILTFEHHNARDLYQQLADMPDDSKRVVRFIGSALLGAISGISRQVAQQPQEPW
jgi:hypothetical protein